MSIVDIREGLLHQLAELREDIAIIEENFQSLSRTPFPYRRWRFANFKRQWNAKKQEELELVQHIASLPPPSPEA